MLNRAETEKGNYGGQAIRRPPSSSSSEIPEENEEDEGDRPPPTGFDSAVDDVIASLRSSMLIVYSLTVCGAYLVTVDDISPPKESRSLKGSDSGFVNLATSGGGVNVSYNKASSSNAATVHGTTRVKAPTGRTKVRFELR